MSKTVACSVALLLAVSIAVFGFAQGHSSRIEYKATEENVPPKQDRQEEDRVSDPNLELQTNSDQTNSDQTNSNPSNSNPSNSNPSNSDQANSDQADADQSKLKLPRSDQLGQPKTGTTDPRPNDPKNAKQRSAKELRRPTTPTDAKALEDRPPTPKFSRSIKSKGSDSYDLTFDDLAFEIKDGEEFRWSMITPEIQQYNGSKVTLRGYIRPSFKQRGLEQFIFVRDNQECCFGPGAALFDCVLVKMASGRGVDYTVRPVTLEGDFYFRKYTGPDGNVWAIFRMKEARLK